MGAAKVFTAKNRLCHEAFAIAFEAKREFLGSLLWRSAKGNQECQSLGLRNRLVDGRTKQPNMELVIERHNQMSRKLDLICEGLEAQEGC